MRIRFAETRLIHNWMLGADHVQFYVEDGRHYIDMLNNIWEVTNDPTYSTGPAWSNIKGGDDAFTIYEYVDGADEIMDWVDDWVSQIAWRGGDPALEEG